MNFKTTVISTVAAISLLASSEVFADTNDEIETLKQIVAMQQAQINEMKTFNSDNLKNLASGLSALDYELVSLKAKWNISSSSSLCKREPWTNIVGQCDSGYYIKQIDIIDPKEGYCPGAAAWDKCMQIICCPLF